MMIFLIIVYHADLILAMISKRFCLYVNRVVSPATPIGNTNPLIKTAKLQFIDSFTTGR
jgi:hypothetical protein